jgi:hypothetical protein
MNPRILAYTALLVLLATPVAAEITFSPEEGIVVGDVLTISGTTSFSPGNRVHVEVQPLSFAPTNKTEPGAFTGYTETAEIMEVQGENRWSVTVNTSTLAPGEYLVTAEVVGTDAVETARFTLHAPTPAPTEYAEPATPTQAPTTVESMTTVPAETATPGAGQNLFACIASIGAACAVAALLLRR